MNVFDYFIVVVLFFLLFFSVRHVQSKKSCLSGCADCMTDCPLKELKRKKVKNDTKEFES